MPDIPYTSRTFRAKTVRVHSIGVVEVSLDLDFGVRVTKVLSIEGMRPSEIPEHLHSNAMHCLVVLLGGKRLLIQPDPVEREGWGRIPSVRARVFVDEKVHGTPVGLTTNIADATGDLLDVAPFCHDLCGSGFRVDAVKQVLNKAGAH
jgi:hypothetical protein